MSKPEIGTTITVVGVYNDTRRDAIDELRMIAAELQFLVDAPVTPNGGITPELHAMFKNVIMARVGRIRACAGDIERLLPPKESTSGISRAHLP